MGYKKIRNLYSDDSILRLVKQVYVSEKIHGTSAKVGWKDGKVWFFSGGAKHETFAALFDADDLAEKFTAIGHGDDCPITVYGEAYGGKMQGMSATYGKELKFVAFEVQVDDAWLNVPNAHNVSERMGLEFVDYHLVDNTLENLDMHRDFPSIQAVRNGMGGDKIREGIVVRPVEELFKSNGERLMAKHKADAFKESQEKQPKPGDPDKQASMLGAREYAREYTVRMRLEHILDSLEGEISMKRTGDVIRAMQKDIIAEEKLPEGVAEKVACKAIGKVAVLVFKEYLRSKMSEKTV